MGGLKHVDGKIYTLIEMSNQKLVEIFRKISMIYRYLGDSDRFRAIAYQKAANVIASLQDDVSEYIKKNALEKIPGIGESIALKIKEFVATGKIQKYEELKKTVPLDLIEMQEISGFGPKSLKRIHEELKINDKEELIAALQDGRIEKMTGFGSKRKENMLRGLKLHKVVEERMLLWNALELAEQIKSDLEGLNEILEIEIAGSLRRMKETIGDIDILIACENKNRKKIASYFTNSSQVKTVLSKGETKVSVLLKNSMRQVDLRMVNEDEWASALQYFTGSKEHNIQLRLFAKSKGYKISEYGIFDLKNGKKIETKTEKSLYNFFGLQYIEPEMREDHGEIKIAANYQLPELISLEDIKGDLQLHSNWTDGSNSIEDIGDYLLKNFNYEYIALTDHSKSTRIANGMSDKQILEQIEAIDKFNLKSGSTFIKKGLEVEILSNGMLDVSDEVLAKLDWVTAAIHQGFKKDNTENIIRACENPYVCCIGHPTGRLIGSREPYVIDINRIIEAAKRTHTALEINAQPQRMDLNDEYAMRARKAGVKLVISTDSHGLKQFDYMKLGVAIARRAWCTKNDILNTKSWNEIENFKREKLKQRNLLVIF